MRTLSAVRVASRFPSKDNNTIHNHISHIVPGALIDESGGMTFFIPGRA